MLIRHDNRLISLLLRYGLALGTVAAAVLLRQVLTGYVGPGLPTYITFYPAVMVTALLAGVGPGLVATATVALVTDYWLLGPPWKFGVPQMVDLTGVVLFSGMGAFMTAVAELYRRSRQRAAAYEREFALRESQETIRQQREWLRVTLTSIGDAVLATDTAGRITFLNPVAEKLTGWPEAEARGQPVQNVFRIVNEQTHAPAEDLVGRVLGEKRVIALGNHAALVTKGGREIPIEDSAAPIKDQAGGISGVVIVFHDVTEKRRAEEALRESRARLEFALEVSHTGQWDLDLVDHTTHRSLQHDRIFGYEALLSDWTYEKFLEHVMPEERELVDRKFRQAVAAGEDWDFECRIRRTDGQVRWIWATGRQFSDGANRARRMAGIVQDVTAHKLAAQFIDAGRLTRAKAEPPKESLRPSGLEVVGAVPWGTHFCQFYASREDLAETLVPYFQAGLAANEFCMWVTSAPLAAEQATAVLRAAMPGLDDYLAKGQIEILDYNRWYTKTGTFEAGRVLQGWADKLAEARRRGFAGLRLTGNTFWLEQADWDDFAQYEEKVNDLIGGQRMIALCTYALEKCGVPEILDVIANHEFALIKNAGQWEVLESAPRDPTDQVLRDREDRMRLALWAAELGVFEWDVAADRAVWENPRMYEIFGRSQDDGPLNTAQLLEQAIDPNDAGAFRAALAEGMKPGHLFHATCRLRRQNDGALRWAEFSGRFERTPAGAPVRLIGVLGDITERKRAEEAIARLNNELEERVQQRTAALEDANAQMESFTYTVSHDLRAPLRQVVGFVNLLEKAAASQLKPEAAQYLPLIQNSVTRMGHLIDDLLAFSRVGRVELKRADVSLQDLLAQVQQTLKPVTEGRAIEWKVSPLPRVRGDAAMLRQVLANLVENALKFTRSRTPAHIEIGCRVEAGQHIFFVRDNGVGFDPRYADKLFGVFQRLHSLSEFEGTGIGLANVRRIIQRHGGRTWAEGALGQGATFYFCLPAT